MCVPPKYGSHARMMWQTVADLDLQFEQLYDLGV